MTTPTTPATFSPLSPLSLVFPAVAITLILLAMLAVAIAALLLVGYLSGALSGSPLQRRLQQRVRGLWLWLWALPHVGAALAFVAAFVVALWQTAHELAAHDREAHDREAQETTIETPVVYGYGSAQEGMPEGLPVPRLRAWAQFCEIDREVIEREQVDLRDLQRFCRHMLYLIELAAPDLQALLAADVCNMLAIIGLGMVEDELRQRAAAARALRRTDVAAAEEAERASRAFLTASESYESYAPYAPERDGYEYARNDYNDYNDYSDPIDRSDTGPYPTVPNY